MTGGDREKLARELQARLRAELAAEKERCAWIVEFHQQRYRRGQPEHVLLANIAAAIRASNAAPPQPEAPISPMAAIAKAIRDGTFRGVLPDAAPPHGAPSAAEGEAREHDYDLHKIIAQFRHPEAEARMLELAREMKENQWTVQFDRDGEELAALVIETFGKDSQP